MKIEYVRPIECGICKRKLDCTVGKMSDELVRTGVMINASNCMAARERNIEADRQRRLRR